MKTFKKFGLGLMAGAFVLSAAVVAMADPPSRVARLQYISGAISVQPGGVKDWVEGAVNRPLTTADRVWADKDSRAELHLGNSLVRVNSETSLTLTNVSDNTVQLELDQGTLNLRIRHLYDGEIFEVDTPNLAFTVTKSGDYRFDVDPNSDQTRIIVWRGEGEATGDGRAVKIRHEEEARFSDGTSLNHAIDDVGDPDGFDDWCHVRNKREDNSISARYVSPDVIGAEDLDAYGTWRTLPTYGAVWVPTVAAGWAPYHYGHWVWVEPWGWTWVDDEPWGFAPAHYGRWVFYSGYWAWVPGPVAVRPVYAPALVAFVGGNHWGVSLSFGAGGGVGWFPLAYGEPYVPAYAVSRTYFQSVNVSNTHITNITNVTNNYYVNNTTVNNTTVTNVNVNNRIVYKNQNVPGAMTAVPKSAMVNAQSVSKVSVQVPEREVRTASVAAVPEVASAKTSVLGMRGATNQVPPAQAAPRQVVARTPPPARPVPFAVKQEALAANPGRPLDASAEERLRARVGEQQPANNRSPQVPNANASGNANANTNVNGGVPKIAPQRNGGPVEAGSTAIPKPGGNGPQKESGAPQPGNANANANANSNVNGGVSKIAPQRNGGPVEAGSTAIPKPGGNGPQKESGVSQPGNANANVNANANAGAKVGGPVKETTPASPANNAPPQRVVPRPPAMQRPGRSSEPEPATATSAPSRPEPSPAATPAATNGSARSVPRPPSNPRVVNATAPDTPGKPAPVPTAAPARNPEPSPQVNRAPKPSDDYSGPRQTLPQNAPARNRNPVSESQPQVSRPDSRADAPRPAAPAPNRTTEARPTAPQRQVQSHPAHNGKPARQEKEDKPSHDEHNHQR